jgi:hypothetical protein
VTRNAGGWTGRSPGTTTASNPRRNTMAGMLRKLLASGVAAKVIQEASKPQNQAKIKEFIAKMGEQNKKRGGGGGYGRGPVR